MAICWERAVVLAFRLCCLFYTALIVCAPFPFGVWGRIWNLIVSVPDRCLFIYFSKETVIKRLDYLFSTSCLVQRKSSEINCIVFNYLSIQLTVCNTVTNLKQ